MVHESNLAAPNALVISDISVVDVSSSYTRELDPETRTRNNTFHSNVTLLKTLQTFTSRVHQSVSSQRGIDQATVLPGANQRREITFTISWER